MGQPCELDCSQAHLDVDGDEGAAEEELEESLRGAITGAILSFDRICTDLFVCVGMCVGKCNSECVCNMAKSFFDQLGETVFTSSLQAM